MNFQSVLLDVLRMIDEWPEVHSFISSFDMRFQKSLTVHDENLQGAALVVYNLINGTRTVQEIIDESLLGRFNTCTILSEFLQAGYISKSSFTPAAPRKSRMGIYYKQVLAAGHYALLSVILLALGALVFSAPQNILPILSPGLIKQSDIADYLNNARLFRIDNALEIYKIRHGVNPGNLQELITSGILTPADLTLQGEKITYLPEHNSYDIKFERRAK
jgi:competence protein ComGC